MIDSLEPVPCRSLLDGVRSTIDRDPTRLAVDDGSLRLTRSELFARAMALAAELVRTVPAGKPVGVYLGNETSFVVAMLACAAAGCPHVAIDVNYPDARNAVIARQAGIGAIIERPERPLRGLPGAAIARVNALPHGDRRMHTPVPPRPLALDDPFVLLYTSGSTGLPKGVIHSQRSLFSSVSSDLAILGFTHDDRSLAMWSPSAIAGIRALLSALHAGALIVLRDPRAGLPNIIDTLRTERITICRATPSLLREIARVEGAREALRWVRVVAVGGERLYGTDVELLRPLLPPDCRISLSYGSTEAGIIAQWSVVGSPRGIVPCGYAVAGTTLEIVDADGLPVPAGEIGELRSTGPASALGYWDGAQLASGSIAPAADPRSRTVATGDLFRRRADGLLEHAGRRDRLVKIRGQRVDLGDIEAAVRRVARVRDAAVISMPDGANVRIVAFVVTGENARASAGDVRRELRSALPGHMVPGEIRFIAAVPQLPGFKPDVAALERLAKAATVRTRPRFRLDRRDANVRAGDVAAGVADVWSRLLGRRSLERDERWDESGGDSLLLLRLAYGIGRHLGRPVPLDVLRSDMRPSELIARLKRFEPSAATHDPQTRTIVLLPGVGGDEPKLVEFRALLGDDVRFFVPAYASWDVLADGDVSLETIVDDVLRDIEAHVADRPMSIVGYSFGGLIAHEVARRLIAMGETIAFVGIIDTNLSPAPAAVPLPVAPRRHRVKAFVQDVGDAGLTEALSRRAGFRIARGALRSARFRRAAVRLRRSVPLPADIAFVLDKHITIWVRHALAARWKPATSEAPTTLFRSRAHPPHAAPDLGWQPYAPDLTIESASGTHATMIVGSDGARLAAALRSALARQPETGRRSASCASP